MCAVLLAAVALTACTAGREPVTDPTDAAGRAHRLWQDRTSHVGENSKVVALAADAGFGSIGTHTLALHTADAPYSVTVAYSALQKPFDTIDFTTQATLLLATITNLDLVEVTSDTQRFDLTSKEASVELGFDVKELGQDEARLAGYLRSLDD